MLRRVGRKKELCLVLAPTAAGIWLCTAAAGLALCFPAKREARNNPKVKNGWGDAWFQAIPRMPFFVEQLVIV